MIGSDDTGPGGASRRGFDRRRFLAYGLGGVAAVAAAGVTGVELVSHGVLPGGQELDQLEGKCSVPSPPLSFSSLGPSISSPFYSQATQSNSWLHDRLSARTRTGKHAAARGDAPRIRGEPHKRRGRHDAGPAGGPPRRSRTARRQHGGSAAATGGPFFGPCQPPVKKFRKKCPGSLRLLFL